VQNAQAFLNAFIYRVLVKLYALDAGFFSVKIGDKLAVAAARSSTFEPGSMIPAIIL